MARRQEAQDTSPTKWQPKETVSNEDNRQPSAIMTELLQGKKVIDRDFETTIEQSNKRIKLIFRPGEIKAHLDHLRKETESKLPPLPTQESLIKVRRNLHPPFLGKALE